VEGTSNLLSHATAYYKGLFGLALGNMFKWNEKKIFLDDDNINFTRPFTIEEVKNALFSVETNRAPGPDNITTIFYQHC
jgi:hypothetical protein